MAKPSSCGIRTSRNRTSTGASRRPVSADGPSRIFGDDLHAGLVREHGTGARAPAVRRRRWRRARAASCGSPCLRRAAGAGGRALRCRRRAGAPVPGHGRRRTAGQGAGDVRQADALPRRSTKPAPGHRPGSRATRRPSPLHARTSSRPGAIFVAMAWRIAFSASGCSSRAAPAHRPARARCPNARTGDRQARLFDLQVMPQQAQLLPPARPRACRAAPGCCATARPGPRACGRRRADRGGWFRRWNSSALNRKCGSICARRASSRVSDRRASSCSAWRCRS